MKRREMIKRAAISAIASTGLLASGKEPENRIKGWEPVVREKECALPRYRPGDLIKTRSGGIGVIVVSKVVVNGGTLSWDEDLPEVIEHGWEPSYAVDPAKKGERIGKHAWWTAHEFESAKLGPLHYV